MERGFFLRKQVTGGEGRWEGGGRALTNQSEHDSQKTYKKRLRS